MIGWLDPDDVAGDTGLPSDRATLERMLQVAYESCLWFLTAGGTEPVPDPVTESMREAQRLDARGWWDAERHGTGDLIGADGQTVRVYPKSAQVRALLRPDPGIPVLG